MHVKVFGLGCGASAAVFGCCRLRLTPIVQKSRLQNPGFRGCDTKYRMWGSGPKLGM